MVGLVAMGCMEPMAPATPTAPAEDESLAPAGDNPVAEGPGGEGPVSEGPVGEGPDEEPPDSMLARCLEGDDSAEAKSLYAEVAETGRDPVRVSIAYWCLQAATSVAPDAASPDQGQPGPPATGEPSRPGEPEPPPTIDPNTDAIGDYEIVAAAERSIQQRVPVAELADALVAEGYPASALNLPDAPGGVSFGSTASVTTHWDFFRSPPGYNVVVSVDSFDDADAIPGREIEYSTCFGCPRLDLRTPGEVVSIAQEYWLPITRNDEIVGVYGALDQERRDTGQPADNLVHRALWWSGPDITHRVATWQPSDLEALLSSLGLRVGSTEELQSAASRLGAESRR